MVAKKRKRTSAPGTGTKQRAINSKPKDLLTPLVRIGSAGKNELIKHTSLYQTAAGNVSGKSSYATITDGRTIISVEDQLLAEAVEYQTWQHFLQDTVDNSTEDLTEVAEKSNRKKKRRIKKVCVGYSHPHEMLTLLIRSIC